MFVLVAYDIGHPKRLKRVAAVLEGYGTRVQRSVFECDLDAATLARLREELIPLVHRRNDRLRFYRLCPSCVRHGSGASSARDESDVDVFVY